MKAKVLLSILLIATTVVCIAGCRKNLPEKAATTDPTKFTDLKVDKAFTFDNFAPLSVNISVNSSSSGSMNIIQIYQDDPGYGKLITSGVAYGSLPYVNSIRVPKAVKNLYISYTSSNGKHESAVVSIEGASLTYIFGGTKSTENTDNSCGSGTAITTNQASVSIGSGQTYYVPYGATVTVITLTVSTGGTFNNCGTLTVNNLNVANTNGIINNNGTFTLTNNVDYKGTFVNNGTLNVTGNHEYKTNSGGHVTNNCTMNVTGSVFTTGSGSLTNNGYVKVIGNDGSIKTTGQGVLTLGAGSLVDCLYFDLEGSVVGPVAATYAGIKTVNGKATGGGSISGYVDFCATGSIQPNNGSYGNHVTFCTQTVPIPSCSNPVAPLITSPLTATGTAGLAITPYVITASGSNPITYNATNMPAGLTFNSSTHAISGTVATAGTFSITLTADNSVGTDTKILVLTIGAAGAPPIITSPLTASATAGSPFSYTITATGENTQACPMTFTASPLPVGLTLQNGILIGGSPTTAGTYDITLTAHNCHAPDNVKHLILTVAPAGIVPVISSPLTASGTAGTVFTPYTLTTSAGTAPITLDATNLPAGLSYDAGTHQITGTPTTPGTTDVTLTASNAYGTDVKHLIITIAQAPGTPPVIQPPLTAAGTVNLPFTPFLVTATGSTPMTFDATGVPSGLSFDPVTHIITGTPTVAGTFTVHLTATNNVGSDNKDLVITIASGGGGSIISYYPNAVDYGTFVFEDLWPYYGDYDCNDLVVNFQYKITSNLQNQITDIEATFIFKAAGASLNNGFGFVLNTNPANVASVTGYTQYGSAVTYDAKGYEAGHSNMTVIIPVDAVNTMFGSGFVNTIVGHSYYQPITKVITIHLTTPQASVGDLPWNPFIFQNQVRSHEIHMKNQPGTDFADQALFGTGNDATNVGQGYYYASSSGLPWAFEIPVNFDYPAEARDILTCYNHFADWAQAPAGPSNPYNNWYEDLPGYRNPANLWHQ